MQGREEHGDGRRRDIAIQISRRQNIGRRIVYENNDFTKLMRKVRDKRMGGYSPSISIWYPVVKVVYVFMGAIIKY